MSDYNCDVLIAGGGPTGVTLAILLARRGVNVIVAEKEADIYPLPRAAHIDHECMRILQEAGAADEVMATCRHASRYDFLNAKGRVLMRFEGADQIGPGGWPGANMIHQPSVERALRRSLCALPDARLHNCWQLESYSAEDDGVTAQIATPDGAVSVRARFLVGADGARSPVRESSGIAFEDLAFEEPWLVVDALVDDPTRLPDANLQICNPDRPTTCVLMGAGRHRWEFMIKPGETADEVSDDRFVARLLEPWNVGGAVRIERKAVYTFRARIADQWRKGRVLLAGDAAHQTPPFAGQGMCSGLRDAENLAWKLAAIVQNGASEELLDSYQPERAPNLRATIDMAITMGRMVCTTSRWAALLRDMKIGLGRLLGKLPTGPAAYPPIDRGVILEATRGAGSYFPQPLARGGSRLDDVLGSGCWLLSRRSLASVALAPFAERIGRWLDDHGADAVLVRPDRYVFGTGDGEMLLASWHAITRLVPVDPALPGYQPKGITI